MSKPLTDEQADDLANSTYRALRATGWNGSMGGLTWDRALIRAARASGWQPIETAPSDIAVLLYTPSLHETNPARVEARVYRDTRGGSCHAWATHWMPLPAPPSDSRATDYPDSFDAKALEVARFIALQPAGPNQGQLLARIQCAVRDAMVWAGDSRARDSSAGSADSPVGEAEAPKESADAKDAQRYRWLRKCRGMEHDPLFTVQHELDGILWGFDLDAAIDAALAASTGPKAG